MGKSGLPKRLRHTALLPQELMHIIFSKLELRDKLTAGLVCKEWDQLLRAGTADARHWRVDYNLDTIWSSTSLKTLVLNKERPEERLDSIVEGWFVKRAAAIKSVHVTATLSPNKDGVAKRNIVRRHLPYLVLTLSKYNNIRLHLNFLDLPDELTPTQFAAICELTNLEELYIAPAYEDGVVYINAVGLCKLASDVSKLVNLKILTLHHNYEMCGIPESISCLQKLENLYVSWTGIECLPASLGTMTSLTSLTFGVNEGIRLPVNVQGWKNMTTVSLVDCELEGIPEQLTGLPALTSLDVSGSSFNQPEGEGWPWWPKTMSRLTQLKVLAMAHSSIHSIPPHISVLRQLTKLDVSHNGLKSLAKELGSLVYLKELVLIGNQLPVPAVLSVIS